LFFRVNRSIDGAAGGLDLPAAEFLLGTGFAQKFQHRRAGDEHRRDFLHHHRIMRRDQPRRAQAGDGTETQTHHRYKRHLIGDVV
jgi:hypothetical protein